MEDLRTARWHEALTLPERDDERKGLRRRRNAFVCAHMARRIQALRYAHVARAADAGMPGDRGRASGGD
jgi:hypothetical protein